MWGIHGGWLAEKLGVSVIHTYPKDMAQNFWMAIYAWTTCFVVTIVVSLLTKPRKESELVGLVYSLTEKPKDDAKSWYARPATLGIVVLLMAVVLNIISGRNCFVIAKVTSNCLEGMVLCGSIFAFRLACCLLCWGPF